MGKIKTVLKADNEGFRKTVEFLLIETGYFDLLSDESAESDLPASGEDGEPLLIDLNTEETIKESFADLLGNIFDRAKVDRKESVRISGESGPSVISLAALDNSYTSDFAVELGERLFAEGYRSAYLSLRSLNQCVPICADNEKGFTRWLFDAGSDRMGNPEKYIIDSGEIFFVGAPIFNPNAGDADAEDISKLLDCLKGLGIDFLIIDMGCHLDLERKKIFLLSDYPILFLGEDSVDEVIFHKHFEGAMPLMEENSDVKLRKIMREILGDEGEGNEEYPIWN